MSFLKKVGGAVKSAVNNAADQMQERRERQQAKQAILNRLELSQLKGVCKEYGVGQPRTYTEDSWTGERSKRTVTREHWVEFCRENVLLDQLVAYCDKRKIRVRDLLPQSDPSGPTAAAGSGAKAPPANGVAAPRAASFAGPRGPPPNMKALLLDIQRHFEPETTRDEREFETQLTVWLKHRFPGQVERQVGNVRGRVDLVLFGQFAIELKIAERVQPLRNLIGQIHAYKKAWEHVGIVLLDVGAMNPATIEEFVQDYHEHGAPAIVLNGDLRRRKTREWVMTKR